MFERLLDKHRKIAAARAADPLREQIDLAHVWLRGSPTMTKQGVPGDRRYIAPGEDDAPHRRALAMVLRSDNPPRDILETLAAAIAPHDDTFASERWLVPGYRFKSRKPPPGKTGAADFATNLLDMKIGRRIQEVHKQGQSIDDAVVLVAEELGMKQAKVWRCWGRWQKRYTAWNAPTDAWVHKLLAGEEVVFHSDKED